MNKKLIWERWQHPLKKMIDNEQAQDTEQSSYIDDDDNEGMLTDKHGDNHVLFTPFGVLPVKELGFSNEFNFWLFYTNFDITEEVASIMEQIPGVESLELYSRYRGRLGVGKLFDENQVLNKIMAELGVETSQVKHTIDDVDESIRNAVEEKLKEAQQCKHWSVLVLPNNEVDMVRADYINENNKALFLRHKDIQQNSRSILIHSDNLL